MIPCYISGKGMYASETTWDFKTAVIEMLESSGLGYDTRFRYYREKFPEKNSADLARLVCDPVEYYDPDWPVYWANKKDEGKDQETVLTEFMLRLDNMFRRNAKVAIFCFDEAGFGSGINTMRFIYEKKPILGFYNPDLRKRDVNLSNIVQLEVEYPKLVTLVQYEHLDHIREALNSWLKKM